MVLINQVWKWRKLHLLGFFCSHQQLGYKYFVICSFPFLKVTLPAAVGKTFNAKNTSVSSVLITKQQRRSYHPSNKSFFLFQVSEWSLVGNYQDTGVSCTAVWLMPQPQYCGGKAALTGEVWSSVTPSLMEVSTAYSKERTAAGFGLNGLLLKFLPQLCSCFLFCFFPLTELLKAKAKFVWSSFW